MKPGKPALNRHLADVLRQGWQGGLPHTKNGPGSLPAYTFHLITALPAFLHKHGITSVADMGCGDLSWVSKCDFAGIDYIGYDYIQPPQVGLRVQQADIFKPLPRAQCALSRHVLIHFTNRQVKVFLAALQADYLLATNDIEANNLFRHTANTHPSYSPINLTLPPFSLRRIDALPELIEGQELALFRL